MERIAVVGLGKLGLNMAVSFAWRGFQTVGIDINQNSIDLLSEGVAPIVEPGLQEMLDNLGGRFRATTEHKSAIRESDVTVVILPTPSDTYGKFSNQYLENAVITLARELGCTDKPYHVFIISSTVMPGSIEERLIPLIEEHSGRKVNVGFGVCYCPEFVALGSVIHDYLNPDLVLIGQSNQSTGEMVESIYRQLCTNEPPVHRMSLVSAEITKVSLNAYITMKISFANTLGNICEGISGANVDEITSALGRDKRISPFYLKSGLGFGGTCFPRDTKAFKVFSEQNQISPVLIDAVDYINNYQDEHLLEIVKAQVRHSDQQEVSILGLAFKPGTPVIEASPAIRLVKALLESGVKVTVYDPLAMDNCYDLLGNHIRYAEDAVHALQSSPVSVVTTQEPEFADIDFHSFEGKRLTIVDCWRIYDPARFGRNIKYIPLGRAISQNKDAT